MAKADHNAAKARASRAMIDAATSGKIGAATFVPAVNDLVKFVPAVGDPFQTIEIDGAKVALIWRVGRLSSGDVPGGGVHVRIEPVTVGTGKTARIIDPRPTGRVVWHAPRAGHLVLVRAAKAAKPTTETVTA